jgi:serine/threonine-protein phosphatase 2B regulatory subunit
MLSTTWRRGEIVRGSAIASLSFPHLFASIARTSIYLQDELVKILKANHMASNEKEVAKKADTILAQADKDGDGVVNFEEFVQVSKRFPNILYPSYTLGQKVAKNLAGGD